MEKQFNLFFENFETNSSSIGPFYISALFFYTSAGMK